MLSGQPYYRECSAALISLAEEGTELVYSQLLELELLEAAHQVALRDRYGKKDWKRARVDGRARRKASRLAEEALEAWSDIVEAVPTRRIEIHDVVAEVPDLMRRRALKSYDAIHAATALYAGARDLYALDSEFARIPAGQLRLFTVSSKVSRMRAIRAGRIK